MSKYLNLISLLGFFFLFQSQAFSQCPDEAGLFCDPTVENGAPILCDIDCLDGFTATMPDTLMEPQPEMLCDDGGSPDNMSWFAFVAGADSISLTVTPSGCNTVDNGSVIYSNIQAGIYDDCDINSRPIVCHNPCNGAEQNTPGPATLSVGDLVPGQTYYFYVDGCGGTVCEYTITVNYGNQPFEILEPSSITSTQVNDGDTICTGFVGLDLEMNNVSPNVNYNWRIFPPILDMPDTDADGFGEFPNVNMSSIVVSFPDVGRYDILGYSDNDCDKTDSVYFTIFVEDRAPVVFDSISICGEDFGSFPGPFQMINGEPLGWMSGVITTPGLSTGTVITIPERCTYEESVFVSQIPSPREPVDIYVCNGMYPINYNGIVLNSAADAGFYAMGTATTGCDSMVNISLIDISANGSFSPGLCTSGSSSIIFTLNSVLPASYDNITYQWYDAAGAIADSDGVDSILQVSASGRYTLEMTIEIANSSCTIEAGFYDINLESIRPNAPILIDPIAIVCADDLVTNYSLATDGTETFFNWFIKNDPSIMLPNDSDIDVDWNATTERELCVSIINDCGVSDTVCQIISIIDIPEVSFTSMDTICVSDVLEVNYTGDVGASLAWDADGGNLEETSPDVFTIQWDIPGEYTMALNGTLNGCSDTLVSKTIVVEAIPIIQNFTCFEFTDKLTYTWDAVDCATRYTLDTNGVVLYQGEDLEFTVEGLAEGQIVNASLQVETGCACGLSEKVQSSCTAQGCPALTIDIDGAFGIVCAEDISQSIQYTASVTGGSGNGVGSWSGDFIDDNGLFDTSLGNGGNQTFYYTIEDGDCTYIDSVSIEILNNPELILDLTDPECYDDTTGEIDIDASGGSGVFTFFIDGSQITNVNDINLGEGSYNIMVLDSENCGDEDLIEISIPDEPALQIIGQGDIVEGNSDILSINASIFVDNVIDSILWYASDGTLLCGSPDCNSISVSPSSPTNYLVYVYYDGGCSIEASYSLLVRPETRITFPNIFSPGGGNPNNQSFFFFTNNQALEVESFQIYSRWGELVHNASDFIASDQSAAWTGKYKGQLLPSGVYTYIFKAKEDGKDIMKNGSITLFR